MRAASPTALALLLLACTSTPRAPAPAPAPAPPSAPAATELPPASPCARRGAGPAPAPLDPTHAGSEGPRQTPVLMGRLDGTAPYGWEGNKKDLEGHFARTMSRLGGTGLRADERDAIFAYLRGMDDGRYATLLALVEGVDGTMGHTAHLSAEDRRALVAYLESL
ncbi:hypothetical protein ACMHYB_59780 [Sorangium sp. So ce1128]